ncbi:MAG: hypothetical protein Q8P67_09230, partial [archaeon]|nr:hypothetical protein [archaeon]
APASINQHSFLPIHHKDMLSSAIQEKIRYTSGWRGDEWQWSDSETYHIPDKLPLTVCIEAGNFWLVPKLIQHGARLDLFADSRMHNHLHTAITLGHHGLIRYLTERFPWLITHETRFSPPAVYNELAQAVKLPTQKRFSSRVLDEFDLTLQTHLSKLVNQLESYATSSLSPAEGDHLSRVLALQYAAVVKRRLERKAAQPAVFRTATNPRPTTSFVPNLIPFSGSESRFQFSFRELFFEEVATPLFSGYDADLAQPNAFLSEVMKDVLKLPLHLFEFSRRTVEQWFGATASPSATAGLAAARGKLAQFAASSSPEGKVDLLNHWFTTIDEAIRAFRPEGDPDLLIFLQSWTLCESAIPNIWTHYFFLCDFMLNGLHPDDDAAPDATATRTLFIFKNAIQGIECLFDQKRSVLVRIEGGIFSNMHTAPPSAFRLLVQILSIFKNNPLSFSEPLTLPCSPGDADFLGWFAETYQLRLVENGASEITIQLLSSDVLTLLNPSVCTELYIMLSKMGN